MIAKEDIKQLFNSSLFKKKYSISDHLEAPAALPDASLKFILELCDKLGIKNIFEFGSGRSTKALLEKGYIVTSLEDSKFWMNQTLGTIGKNNLSNHSFFIRPLKFRFLGLHPVLDWKIDDTLASKIKEAELILVDSPYYTPFRESTLWSGLTKANGAIIVLDDTRIPTLQRFCDRLSNGNEALLHARIGVGHGFDIFFKDPQAKIYLKHSLIDLIKGWYRYYQGVRFYSKLKITFNE